ncbi:MAG TPA: hypothetical protein VF475_10035 [Sphingobium sp.]
MIWLPALLLSCLIVEMFAHIPIAQSAVLTLQSGARARRVILSPGISDHWKERVMPVYALRMGRQWLVLAGYFAIFAVVAAGAMAIMERAMPEAALFMLSARGVAFGFAVSILYFCGRRRFVRA